MYFEILNFLVQLGNKLRTIDKYYISYVIFILTLYFIYLIIIFYLFNHCLFCHKAVKVYMAINIDLKKQKPLLNS
jgi:hypothetical protein